MADSVIEIQALLQDEISAQIAEMRANIQAEMAQANEALEKSKAAFSSFGEAVTGINKKQSEWNEQEKSLQAQAFDDSERVRIAAIANQDNREQEELKDTYRREEDAAKGHDDVIAKLKADCIQALKNLDAKQAADHKASADAQSAADKAQAKAEADEALRQREAQIKNQIEMAKFEAGSTKNLDEKYSAKKKELDLEEQLEILMTQKTGISVAEINRQFAEKKMALDREESEAQMKSITDQASFAVSSLDKITAGNKSMAEAHKIISIAEAEINTAKAVTAAMSTPFEIPFIIAEGAMQVAKIESQKFAVGTSYATGGWADVGEEGPERMYVPRGSKINRTASTQSDNSGGGHTFHIHAGNDKIVETLRVELRKGGAMTRLANELAIAAGVKL